MYVCMCVSVCVLEWFRPPGSGHTESVNLSVIFSFGCGSGSILLIVPKGAPYVCMRRICVCDCLHRPSHGLCSWPRSHAWRAHSFYGGSALVLLLVLRYSRYVCMCACIYTCVVLCALHTSFSLLPLCGAVMPMPWCTMAGRQ